MTPWKAFCFLYACLSDRDAEAGTEDILTTLLSTGAVHWEAVLRVADREGLLPALYCALRDKGLLAYLADDVRELLAEIHRLNSVRNGHILTTMTSVNELFVKAGLRPVWLKGGAYLASGVFSDPGEFIMLDLDVLVPKNEVTNAAKALEADGWTPGRTIYPPDHHHLVPYYHQDHLVRIETHFDLTLECNRHLLPAASLLANAVSGSSKVPDLLVPSPTHMALHHIIEAFINTPAGTGRRKYLSFARIVRRFGDRLHWPSLVGAFTGENDAQVMADALLTVEFLLARRIPEAFRPHPLLHLAWTSRLWAELVPFLHEGLLPTGVEVDPASAQIHSELEKSRRQLELYSRTDTALLALTSNCLTALEKSRRQLQLHSRTDTAFLALISNCLSALVRLLPRKSLPCFVVSGVQKRVQALRDFSLPERRAILKRLFSLTWWSKKIHDLAGYRRGRPRA
ncbi:MAG: nucleotidyltransferase family protein [Deltaproteobacteria bacterium]|nr:nucleotidyltransferase family protein [Deltaproteobacteria bacterium]